MRRLPTQVCNVNPRPTRGFTLLEVLVVLAVLSLVLTLAFAAFRTTSGTAERLITNSAGADDIVGIQDFLRTLVARTYPTIVHVDPTHYRVSFDGTADVMEFTSVLPHHFAFGYQRMVLRKAVRNGKERLILAWTVERDKAQSLLNNGGEHEAIIFPEVRSVTFKYFGSMSGDNSDSWHDTWEDQTRVPTLVQIAIVPNDSRYVWPLLDIKIRTDVDSTCVVDLLTHRCEGR